MVQNVGRGAITTFPYLLRPFSPEMAFCKRTKESHLAIKAKFKYVRTNEARKKITRRNTESEIDKVQNLT